MILLKVSDQFTMSPGGRLRSDGPHSGEEFRECLLEVAFVLASPSNKVVVDLDGTYGYATGFLEEAFGGLARRHGPEKVLSLVELVSKEEPYLVEEVRKYILEARG